MFSDAFGYAHFAQISDEQVEATEKFSILRSPFREDSTETGPKGGASGESSTFESTGLSFLAFAFAPTLEPGTSGWAGIYPWFAFHQARPFIGSAPRPLRPRLPY